MRRNISILNTEVIKVIGIIFLTFDTIGIFLMARYASVTPTYNLGFIFKIIGVISYPLLIFSYVNEFKASESKNKYLKYYSLFLMLPLLILQTIIYVLGRFNIVNKYVYLLPNMPGHIFMDIFLILWILFLLINKNKYIKLLSILPLAYIGTCFGFNIAEHIGLTGSIPNFPNYIRPQLDILSLIIGVGFYYSHGLSTKLSTKLNENTPIENNDESLYKLFCVIILFLTILIYWLLTTYAHMVDIYSVNESHILTYCLLSCFFLLMYSFKEAKLPKYLSYIENTYYLMHIVIILIIFTVI